MKVKIIAIALILIATISAYLSLNGPKKEFSDDELLESSASNSKTVTITQDTSNTKEDIELSSNNESSVDESIEADAIAEKENLAAAPNEATNDETEYVEDHSVSKEEQKAITEQTLLEFQNLDVPTDLPTEHDKLYAITNDLYLKTSYYLNEVAAGNIKSNREDMTKALNLVLLHGDLNDVTDMSDVLNMIKSDQSSLFQEAIKELRQEQAEQVEYLLKVKDEEDDQEV